MVYFGKVNTLNTKCGNILINLLYNNQTSNHSYSNQYSSFPFYQTNSYNPFLFNSISPYNYDWTKYSTFSYYKPEQSPYTTTTNTKTKPSESVFNNKKTTPKQTTKSNNITHTRRDPIRNTEKPNVSHTLNIPGYNPEHGLLIAEQAKKHVKDYKKVPGQATPCARFVREDMEALGIPWERRRSAADLVIPLSKNPNFKELDRNLIKDCDDIPIGSVIIYQRGDGPYSKDHGHAEIAIGNGKAAHFTICDIIMTEGMRVFVPINLNIKAAA